MLDQRARIGNRAADPSEPRDSAELPPETVADLAAEYSRHRSLMIGIAVGRFGISACDAETLAHDVFLDFILKNSRVTNVRSWLVASMFNASKYFTRVQARTESLPADFDETADPSLERVLQMWPDQLAAREAFSRTTARCQLVLHLRYIEGYTIPEIAQELGTTKRYAAKLVHECLQQAHRRYTEVARRGTR